MKLIVEGVNNKLKNECNIIFNDLNIVSKDFMNNLYILKDNIRHEEFEDITSDLIVDLFENIYNIQTQLNKLRKLSKEIGINSINLNLVNHLELELFNSSGNYIDINNAYNNFNINVRNFLNDLTINILPKVNCLIDENKLSSYFTKITSILQ